MRAYNKTLIYERFFYEIHFLNHKNA